MQQATERERERSQVIKVEIFIRGQRVIAWSSPPLSEGAPEQTPLCPAFPANPKNIVIWMDDRSLARSVGRLREEFAGAEEEEEDHHHHPRVRQ